MFLQVFVPRVEISLLQGLIPLEMEENENGRVASPDHLQDFQLFFFFLFSTNFILPSYLFLSLDYEALQKRVHSLWKNFLQGGRERGEGN